VHGWQRYFSRGEHRTAGRPCCTKFHGRLRERPPHSRKRACRVRVLTPRKIHGDGDEKFRENIIEFSDLPDLGRRFQISKE